MRAGRSLAFFTIVDLCIFCASCSPPVKEAPSTIPPTLPSGRKLDVIYWPTSPEATAKLLELAEPKPSELVYDLGCGDGRILVAAARNHGVRAIGIDLDPKRVAEARENVRKAGLEKQIEIRQGDLFEADFSDADIVALFLLANLNERLKPAFAKLRPGVRIVTNVFRIPGVKAEKKVRVRSTNGEEGFVHLYVTPLQEDPSDGMLGSTIPDDAPAAEASGSTKAPTPKQEKP